MSHASELTAVPGDQSARTWVMVLLTLEFWLAVVCWVAFSPSVLTAVGGVLGVFAVNAATLIGYGLAIDVSSRSPVRR